MAIAHLLLYSSVRSSSAAIFDVWGVRIGGDDSVLGVLKLRNWNSFKIIKFGSNLVKATFLKLEML